MPGTPTPIYGLTVPTVSGDSNAWGGELNTDLGTLDTVIGLPRIARGVPTGGALDLSAANFYELTVSAPVTVSFTNVPAGTYASQVILKVVNGGSAAITWPGSVTWIGGAGAPVLQASGVDFLLFWTNNNGTNWYGARLQASSFAGQRTLHWSEGSEQAGGAYTTSLTFGSPDGGAVCPPAALGFITWLMPINVPVGATITAVAANVFRNSETGTQLSMSLFKFSSSGGAAQVGTTQNSTNGGWQQLSISGLSEVAALGVSYALLVPMTAGSVTAQSAMLTAVLVTTA